MSSRSLSLIEILIAITLISIVILAATSVDITSRRFFLSSKDQGRMNNEAKIVMEHIIKNLQLGIGDVTTPGTTEGITETGGGSGIQIKLDTNDPFPDGMFTSTSDGDTIIDYTFSGDPDYKITYSRDDGSDTVETEDFAVGIATTAIFNVGVAVTATNQADVTITLRVKPEQDAGPQNPEATLTSSAVLKAMSTN